MYHPMYEQSMNRITMPLDEKGEPVSFKQIDLLKTYCKKNNIEYYMEEIVIYEGHKI